MAKLTFEAIDFPAIGGKRAYFGVFEIRRMFRNFKSFSFAIDFLQKYCVLPAIPNGKGATQK